MKFILIFILMVFPTGIHANEIVINSQGQLIRLFDDKTWEFVDTSEESGKLVFKITGAREFELAPGRIVNIEKDDFGTVKEYRYFFGAQYDLEITNNLDFPVRVNWVRLWSDVEWRLSSGSSLNLQGRQPINTLLQPGESVTRRIDVIANTASSTEFSEEMISEKRSRWGLEAQRDTLSVAEYSTLGRDSFVFPPDSGISSDAIGQFLMGSEDGVVPLKPDVIFF